jgi:hypothetical protein
MQIYKLVEWMFALEIMRFIGIVLIVLVVLTLAEWIIHKIRKR